MGSNPPRDMAASDRLNQTLAPRASKAYLRHVAGSALLVIGCIPVALSNSEGAGSVWAVVRLPGAHLYIQVLGNERTKRLAWSRHTFLLLRICPTSFARRVCVFRPPEQEWRCGRVAFWRVVQDPRRVRRHHRLSET